MTEEREESRIQWHPAFYAAAKLELRDNIDELEFYPEYNLSKKPLQADLLFISVWRMRASIKVRARM